MQGNRLAPNFVPHPQCFAVPTRVGNKRKDTTVPPTQLVFRQPRRRMIPPQSFKQPSNLESGSAKGAITDVSGNNKQLKIVTLPQRTPPAVYAMRRARIDRARTIYRWSHDHVSHAALLDQVPERELPSKRWVVKVKRVEGTCEKNAAELFNLRKSARGESSQNTSSSSGRAQSRQYGTEDLHERKVLERSCDDDVFQRYKDQFVRLEEGAVAKSNQFLQDDVFGWYRIAGPNPMQLRACEQSDIHRLPELNDEMFQSIGHFESDCLRDAFDEHRLFIADYPELAHVSSSSYSAKQKPRQFAYSPTALFAVPKEHDVRSSLLPVAIRCGREESFPLYTASERFTDPVTWLAAKLTVQVADAMVHEIIYHFARTHLLLEVFVCATNRCLSDEHPLYVLLEAHFEGTAFINNNSLRTLVSAGGIIDQLTASDIKDTQEMAANGLKGDFSFNDSMPDVELKSRGVTRDETVLNFPYRDDALELWGCVLEWSQRYVFEFYKDDKDVEDDYEVEMWAKEVVENGGVQGFGEEGKGLIRTRGYLSRVVAMVIFSGSVQHAAVNFPQCTMMNFSPAMPLCGYCEAPREARPFGSIEELVEKMMPGLEYAETQMYAAELLGVVRHTRLGEYGKRFSFAGAGVERGLVELKARLEGIGERIGRRNALEREAGLPEYNYLVPKNVPQSTNI